MCICRKNRACLLSLGKNHEKSNFVLVDGFSGDSGYVRIKFLSVEVLKENNSEIFFVFSEIVYDCRGITQQREMYGLNMEARGFLPRIKICGRHEFLDFFRFRGIL